MKNKKKWIKPELVVLTKLCQDENILCSCKQNSNLEGQRIEGYYTPMCYYSRNGTCCPSRLTNNS
jgi:hypothetical protein